MAQPSAQWSHSLIAGGFLTSGHPVVWSADTKYLFGCQGLCIKVFNVETGEPVRQLLGHTTRVTSVALNPANPLQLFSTSLDGRLLLWDYSDGVILQAWDLQHPIESFVLDPVREGTAYVVLGPKEEHNSGNWKRSEHDSAKEGKQDQKEEEKGEDGKSMDVEGENDNNNDEQKEGEEDTKDSELASTNKTKKKPKPFKKKTNVPAVKVWRLLCFQLKGKQQRVISKSMAPFGELRVSPNGDYLATRSFGKNEFSLHSLTRTGKPRRVTHKFEITCLHFHPTEYCVVFGDTTGCISFNYCLASNGSNSKPKAERPVITNFHWHAHSPRSLAFSPDGAYMYSGGEEAVFVIWQLKTGHKDFLPRLGSTINGITPSPDFKYYALSCADNSIRIINALSMTEERLIQGLKPVQVFGKSRTIPTGLVVEPRQNLIVLNGRRGTLQFYDALADRHAFELEVCAPPAVNVFNNVRISEAVVENICFSPDGMQLVTVDRGPEPDETSLKFWHWDLRSQNFVMNTRMDNPHVREVTGLVYHPTLNLVVSCSRDKKFKIWTHVRKPGTPTTAADKTAWMCRSVGFYKDSPATAAAFSSDGSLLAIAYGQVITLWDAINNALHHTLCHPVPNEEIKGLAFVPDTSFLVCYTKDQLFVWNLLTSSVWWSYRLNVISLAVDPFQQQQQFYSSNKSEPRFVVSTKKYLLLFSPTSPKPIWFWRVSKKNPVESLAFLNSSTRSERAILYLNARKELFKLEQQKQSAEHNNDEGEEEVTTEKQLLQDANQQLTHFEKMFGKTEQLQAKGKKKKKEDEDQLQQLDAMQAPLFSDLFDAPSHVIPPPSKLYLSFMDSLLKKPNTSMEERGEDEETESTSTHLYSRVGEAQQQAEASMDVEAAAQKSVATTEEKGTDTTTPKMTKKNKKKQRSKKKTPKV
ncbi:NET1-associated nuclear protein 1 [Balamuthia mandrillaris]